MPNLSKSRLAGYLCRILASCGTQKPEQGEQSAKLHMIGGSGSTLKFQFNGRAPIQMNMPAQGPPTLYIWGDGFEARAQFIEECAADPVLGSQVSSQFIAKRLDALIQQLACQQDNDVPDDIVREFLKSVRSSVREWLVYLPVDNLVVDQVTPFEFGGVVFIPKGEAMAQVMEQTWAGIDKSPHTDKKKGDFKVILAKSTLDSYEAYRTCAKIKIQAEADQSVQIAQDRAGAVLNVLRCYTPFLFPRNLRAYIGLGGTLERYERTAFLFSDEGFKFKKNMMGALQEFILDPPCLEKLRHTLFLDRFDALLVKPAKERTNLENALFVAAQWIGSGIVSSEPAQAILRFTIGLETLLHGAGGEGISDKIATRAAHILGGEDRYHTYRMSKQLYELRSKVVHTGEGEFDEQDIAQLEMMAVQCLIQVAQRSDEWSSQQDLVKWAEEQSFKSD